LFMIRTQLEQSIYPFLLGQKLKKPYVFIKLSKKTKNLSQLFLKEGLIRGFSIDNLNNSLKLFLKYKSSGEALVVGGSIMLKSKIYQYLTVKELKKLPPGFFFLISTSRGIVSHLTAIRLNCGGVLLVKLFF